MLGVIGRINNYFSAFLELWSFCVLTFAIITDIMKIQNLIYMKSKNVSVDFFGVPVGRGVVDGTNRGENPLAVRILHPAS